MEGWEALENFAFKWKSIARKIIKKNSMKERWEMVGKPEKKTVRKISRAINSNPLKKGKIISKNNRKNGKKNYGKNQTCVLKKNRLEHAPIKKNQRNFFKWRRINRLIEKLKSDWIKLQWTKSRGKTNYIENTARCSFD